MKKSIVVLLAFSLAIAVGAVAFWYGSGASIGTAGPLQPADETDAPSPALTRQPASTGPVLVQTSQTIKTKAEIPPALAAPSTRSRTRVADTGRLTAKSAPAARDGDTIHAEPSSPDEPSVGALRPNAPPSARKLGLLGVAVPLAFQDVDLFINTPQGLKYAPVDFNQGSDAGGASGASAANATPTPGSPGTMVVDEASAATLEQMRDDFANQVGGLGQDASDPEYVKRWRTAQQLSDSWFRARFGWQAFNSYQLAAAQKAESEKQAAAQK